DPPVAAGRLDRVLADLDVQRAPLAAPVVIDDHVPADRLVGDVGHQIARGFDGPAGDLGDDVARLEPGRVRRTAGRDAGHDGALGGEVLAELGAQGVGDVGHGDDADADVRVANAPLLDEDGRHVRGLIDRDGEAVAAARADVDQSVEPQHLSLEIDQWAARVPGVDLGVGLDLLADALARGEVEVAAGLPDAADDPGGHRLVEAQRAPHGDDPLADPQLVGIAHPRRHQPGRRLVEPHHADVGQGVGPDHAAGEGAVVGQLDGHFLRALDDVAVGHDVPLVVDDDPRAGPLDGHAPLLRLGRPEVEELADEVRQRGLAELARFGELRGVVGPFHVQAHDAGPDG